ncbi:hypothetical protein MNBD_GAMMA12-389 [hydrothermal vent metagenome]|uniref:Uncharacterized protein n=1 Tax=hydrothermal vent metagenome TaxID=652676 RepID=A0A3B0YQX4_9ZZZZ
MNLVKIFKPRRASIVFFILIASYFLSQKGEYQGEYNGTIQLQADKITVVGYPYIYYRTLPNNSYTFHTRSFLKNLAVYYIFVSVLLAFSKYASSTYRKGSHRQKVIFTSSIIYFMLGFIVLLKTFGGEWLNKYTERESTRTIKILLTLGVNPNSLSGDSKRTPLIIAARKNNVELADLLIRRGADVGQVNTFGRSALHEAVQANALQVVTRLISAEANIHALDEDQSMPIHLIKGYEVSLLLLDRGALANVKNAKSLTPIFFAPDDRTLKLLISRGAKLNVSTNDGSAPIAYARNPQVIRYLVNRGANVNSKNSDGETPLHRLLGLSAKKNIERNAVIKFLIRRGANVDLRDVHGLSPLHYSIKNCDLDSAQLFYVASREVRRQLAYRRLRGQLSVVRKGNISCWKKIRTAVAKSRKVRQLRRSRKVSPKNGTTIAKRKNNKSGKKYTKTSAKNKSLVLKSNATKKRTTRALSRKSTTSSKGSSKQGVAKNNDGLYTNKNKQKPATLKLNTGKHRVKKSSPGLGKASHAATNKGSINIDNNSNLSQQKRSTKKSTVRGKRVFKPSSPSLQQQPKQAMDVRPDRSGLSNKSKSPDSGSGSSGHSTKGESDEKVIDKSLPLLP